MGKTLPGIQAHREGQGGRVVQGDLPAESQMVTWSQRLPCPLIGSGEGPSYPPCVCLLGQHRKGR